MRLELILYSEYLQELANIRNRTSEIRDSRSCVWHLQLCEESNSRIFAQIFSRTALSAATGAF